MTTQISELSNKIFARDKSFWNNYLKGRPQAPQSFFDRIYSYHEELGGNFGTAHDVGAGNGPYSAELRSKFQHVIVSDIIDDNVKFASERLGTDGFSYRTAKVEEADDISPGSVDLVFATNVLHFVDQQVAIEAIARQLRPGGTFAAAGFGPALFDDPRVQDVWNRISQQGGRVILGKTTAIQDTINVMERSSGGYNVAPLSGTLFLPGAKRVHLNQKNGGITGLLPPERQSEGSEPNHTGPSDVETFEEEEGWRFSWNLKEFYEHFGSFPHSKQDPSSFVDLWKELDDLLASGARLEGVFPATLILAKRR
ncbi:S-adenosyl-L-methionine-dependent methyltransferase [Lophiostoma macrostomum CBS 122681]|uniref:S-adenosyl-L-methionine-dependent methyltransferase n=1 Tax=Lophiostoma macrostomum CBS 122681 TaxID=1314788 RepID=A0A6A6SLJ9_9PLEO|nr:S-adenosyl-L-methionine-dependent methyltransferase [Lophiostoma macrostomum CBS 122681]